MSTSLKLTLFYMLLIITLICVSSCNSVNRVLTNSKKFEIVAKEVVKRGYCINDTVIIDSSRIDTLYKQNYIVDTFTIQNNFNIDTVFKSGAVVSVKDGIVSVKCPSSKEIVKTITKTQYIRDLKLESILKQESTSKSDTISNLLLTIKDKELTIRDKNISIAKAKTELILLLVIIGLSICVYVYFKFKLI